MRRLLPILLTSLVLAACAPPERVATASPVETVVVPQAPAAPPPYALSHEPGAVIVTAHHRAGIVVRSRHPQQGWDVYGEPGLYVPPGAVRTIVHGDGWQAVYRLGDGSDWRPLR